MVKNSEGMAVYFRSSNTIPDKGLFSVTISCSQRLLKTTPTQYIKNPLPLYHVTSIYLLSFAHISATLNHLYLLQGTQDACHFQLTFYGPNSKLPLHPSGPEIHTKSTITSEFLYNFADTGQKTITFGNKQNYT